MQPSIREIKRKRRSIGAFRGLCHRPLTPEGYFSDALNLTADGYPAITSRKARGIVTETGEVGAMYSHAQMCWLWGTTLYYGDTPVGTLTAGEKQFASLGAYVVIYPDKKILNTDALTLTDMENRVTVNGAQISACNADGSDAAESNYVKIASGGIGAGFSEGDGVMISGLAGELSGGSYLIQTVREDAIVVIASVSQSYREEGEITVARTAPDLDFICALDNRIWGCSSAEHQIYASKLGDPGNWMVFQGISTDAYRAVLPSPGDFTGVSADLGSVIFFKEEEIIRLYGSKPSNFQLVSYKMPGVEAGSGASIAYTESALFYKGLAGVYMYDGSIPENISAALGSARYTNARAGAINGKYYVSMKNADENEYRLFVYDTATGAWYRESAPEVRYFVREGSNLYFACANGHTYSLNGPSLWYDKQHVVSTMLCFTESRVEFLAVTGYLTPAEPEREYVKSLQVRFALGDNASLSIYIQASGQSEWKRVGTFSAKTAFASETMPVPVRRGAAVRLKMQGTGEAAVTGIIKTYETGSDA